MTDAEYVKGMFARSGTHFTSEVCENNGYETLTVPQTRSPGCNVASPDASDIYLTLFCFGPDGNFWTFCESD